MLKSVKSGKFSATYWLVGGNALFAKGKCTAKPDARRSNLYEKNVPKVVVAELLID